MTMTPNQDQIKSIVRWGITAFGGILAGWFAHTGFVTTQQVMNVLNSPAFLSFAVSAIGAVWGLMVHTKSNTVAAANAIPEVAGVIMTNTGDGRTLASSAAAAGVVVAGTNDAAKLAAQTGATS